MQWQVIQTFLGAFVVCCVNTCSYFYYRGPGWKIGDLESNRIIGENQALKALELYNTSSSSGTPVQGKVDFVQRYWGITKTVVTHHGEKVKLCAPAMVRRRDKLFW